MSFRSADLPFDGVTNRFIVFFVQYQDLEQAAKVVHISVEYAQSLYSNPEIRAEIDKRLNLFHVELAKLNARAALLSEPFLDSQLLDVIEQAPNDSNVKVRALDLGYKKLGLVKEKVEHSGEGGGPMVFTLEHIKPKQAKELP